MNIVTWLDHEYQTCSLTNELQPRHLKTATKLHFLLKYLGVVMSSTATHRSKVLMKDMHAFEAFLVVCVHRYASSSMHSAYCPAACHLRVMTSLT